MEFCEVVEAVADVVATLGKLAAIVTSPCRRMWQFVFPRSLPADLRRFTWTLRDTLDHCDVTSLGQRGVTSLSQALAALGTTPGATWADVRAMARAWREWVDKLHDSWSELGLEASGLLKDWEDVATTKATATAQVGDLQDKTAGWGTAGENLVATAQQLSGAVAKDEVDLYDEYDALVEAAAKAIEGTSQAGVATSRGQEAKVVQGLLKRLLVECDRAKVLPLELHELLVDIENTLKGTNEASIDVPEPLVIMVAKFERLWETSTHWTKHHLLQSLENIYHLLLSPNGGSGGHGGPVSPSGPGGLSMAKRCRESTEDTLRPCKKQRTAPPHGDTNNGSSIPGTPEQPEGTWGKPEPGAVCDIARQLPRDPDLLPPGTRCELTASKMIHFLNNSCHECIATGVTGTSRQRQDFLIIGKDSNRTLGLSVLPAVVSVNCNEELRVLALAHKSPLLIQPKTPIAIAIALPMNTNKQAEYPEMPFESSNPHGRWIKHINCEWPEQTCSLTHLGKTVHVTGKLDTGADVTVISYEFWPTDWNLVPPDRALTGIGGGTVSVQSESMITVTGPEGKTATVRPYVVKKRITLWGRDVMSQWRAKMELDS